MSPELSRITVTFGAEGTEYTVTYTHSHEQLTPGSKRCTPSAAAMARMGLEAALGTLGSGPVMWGGFGTDTRVSKDTIVD